jgi:hypothetical protein
MYHIVVEITMGKKLNSRMGLQTTGLLFFSSKMGEIARTLLRNGSGIEIRWSFSGRD